MVSSTKKLVESYIQKYIELKVPTLKIKKNSVFICPFHEEHEEDNGKPTCKMFTKHGHVIKCFDPSHNKYWNIFDLVRKFEPEMKEFSDDDIAEYLTHLLDIKSNEEIDKLLMMYHDAGFGLIALSPNSKNPVAGQSWLNNTSYEISQWREWINNGLGLGLRLGDASKVVAIDIDSQEALDKMRDLMGDTFMQVTRRGVHFIYSYEPDFDGINHQNFRTKGLEAELRANNAYIVVAPTLVDNFTRYWNYKKILPMPVELKKYILSLIDKTDKIDNDFEKMPDETLRGDLKGLDGRCNDTFIKMGGVLRKKLPLKQTEYALMTFNKLLAEPLPYKDIKGMMYQISRYNNYDQKELADEILNHLKLIQQSTARDLQASLGFEKKNIEEVLSYLVDEGKITKHRNTYKMVDKIEWEEDFMSIRNPLKFNVPYFHNYANFDMGDMIVIGAKPGVGKCITEGLLSTNQGFIDIKDIGKNRPEGISTIGTHTRIFSGVKNEKIYRTTNYFYKEKVNHTIKIKTYHGFELEGTPEHPIMIIDKNKKKIFKKLEDLNINDSALMVIPNLYPKAHLHKNRKLNKRKTLKHATRLKSWDVSRDFNDDIARLFGYILGDAHIEKSCVKIYQNIIDTRCINEITDLCIKLNLPLKRHIINKCVMLSINSVDFVYYCKIKLFEQMPRKNNPNIKSPKRQVPKCILTSSKECQIAFLESLFNCESNLNSTKRGGHLEITMASKNIIDTMHLMLLNLGIIARKAKKKVKAYPNNSYWRLSINEAMTYKFFKILNPVKYDKENINGFYQNNTKIRWIGNNQSKKYTQFSDKIISIEHDYTEKYVYDFNMDSNKYKIKNQFWSNGFISHNTTISCNFVKEFVNQGIRPNLICTEAGSKFGITLASLGVKVGDIKFKIVSDPTSIELEDNAITILDWLSAGSDSDYSKMDSIYSRLNSQLVKHGGFLIVFAQLKQEDGNFYAESMTRFYASLVAKYNWSPIKNEKGVIVDWDARHTYFHTEKIRDSKTGKQYLDIPMEFNPQTKILSLRGK